MGNWGNELRMNQSSNYRFFMQYSGLLLTLVLLVGVFSLLSKNFFQFSTLITIFNQIPALTFVSIGMTFVLITGGIDLSVGAIVAISSAVLGVVMVDYECSFWVAFPLSILTACVCGLLNGSISIGLRIPSFIVTLGMLEMARGTTKVLTESKTKYIGSDIEFFGEPLLEISISAAFLAAFLCVLLGQLVLSHTILGRYCKAIGTNIEAVKVSGIVTWPYSISVFVISGFCCGLASLSQTARLASADPNMAIGMELSAIAACVIGGTSLSGGKGNVISTFIGVILITVLQTGLAQTGVQDAYKQIISGGVIVIAVVIDTLRTRWVRGSQ